MFVDAITVGPSQLDDFARSSLVARRERAHLPATTTALFGSGRN
jgi:hypothetical protein